VKKHKGLDSNLDDFMTEFGIVEESPFVDESGK
jgi:hypothetical protein